MSVPEFKVGLRGFIRLEVYDSKTDKKTFDTGWFENLITNIGLDAIAQYADVMSHFHVGTSNTTPLITDTWVNAFVATTNTVRSTVDGVSGTVPHYGYKRRTQRFDVGDATGNLQECAVGWSATTGTAFSHALIQDAGGNPISITVLADEYLDFTYELRYYPPASDTTGTCFIDTDEYYFTTRALAVTSTYWWSQSIGNLFTYDAGFESYHRAYTGGLADITASAPLGTDGGSGSGTTNITVTSYQTGQYFRDFQVTADTTQWVIGEIRSIVLGCKGNRWQSELSRVSDGAGIAKSNDPPSTLLMNWRVSWDRAS